MLMMNTTSNKRSHPALQENRISLPTWNSILPVTHSFGTYLLAGAVIWAVDMVTLFGAGMAAHGMYGMFMRIPEEAASDIANAHIVLVTAVFFSMLRLICGDYSTSSGASLRQSVRQLFLAFLLSCGGALFVTAASAELDPVRIYEPLLFAFTGLTGLVAVHSVFPLLRQKYPVLSQIEPRRVFLVGFEDDIAAFTSATASKHLECRIIGSTVLRKAGSAVLQREDLSLAVSIIRFLKPDDVLVLLPWSNAPRLEQCLDALYAVPAELYVWPSPVFKNLHSLHLSSLGCLPALALARHIPSRSSLRIKRGFDILIAAVALVLLTPVFALTALAIRLDSKGPVFFVQKRYGFNQEPFHVFKFRTMRVSQPLLFQQAILNDPRITRVGAYLRRWNIDELPQLLNVLRGDMSLVGPRPHAMAHDHEFMRSIGVYARRHNVKPGITGWAQANGLRGETITEGAMQARVEHDLYYITHWSFWLDIKIMVMTVMSRSAYKNAF
jgi:Undecaprenyl-phosphate glucose phosphotransferase